MIDKLSLPTDNLYKFMAVAGLAITIISLFPTYFWYNFKIDVIEANGRIDLYNIENSHWTDKKKGSLEPIVDAGEISLKINLSRSKIDTDRKIIKHKEKHLVILHHCSQACCAFGVVLSLWGIFLWYIRTQYRLDLILACQTIEAVKKA